MGERQNLYFFGIKYMIKTDTQIVPSRKNGYGRQLLPPSVFQSLHTLLPCHQINNDSMKMTTFSRFWCHIFHISKNILTLKKCTFHSDIENQYFFGAYFVNSDTIKVFDWLFKKADSQLFHKYRTTKQRYTKTRFAITV